MDAFCRECLRFGCLKEFEYFSLYLRGREELLVTVYQPSDNATPSRNAFVPSPSPIKMMLETRVPPASPAAHEEKRPDSESVFLLGGYARYKCPYVWLRSCSKQLQRKMAQDMDMPLKLNTTEQWKQGGVRAWDMVAEVLRLAIKPPPHNPFKIDRTFYSTMATFESCLAAGAMASFLNELYMSAPPYASDVLDDLQFVLDLHYTTLPEMVLSGSANYVAISGGVDQSSHEDESDETPSSSPSTSRSTPAR